MRKFMLLCGLITISGCAYSSGDAEMKEIRLQRLAREYLTPHLKDPSSAEFRNQKGLCGEVNSNNSFGGKVGYQRFIVGNEKLYMLERESGLSSTDFNLLWSQMCK